jgi:hypothetical protein
MVNTLAMLVDFIIVERQVRRIVEGSFSFAAPGPDPHANEGQ